jgi:hypothetical protein
MYTLVCKFYVQFALVVGYLSCCAQNSGACSNHNVFPYIDISGLSLKPPCSVLDVFSFLISEYSVDAYSSAFGISLVWQVEVKGTRVMECRMYLVHYEVTKLVVQGASIYLSLWSLQIVNQKAHLDFSESTPRHICTQAYLL